MTADERGLADLVSRLDLEAKVRLLTGETFFTLYGEETVGLAPMAFSDGPTGVRGLEFTGGPTSALLPNATLLAATWRTDSLHAVGELLAEEAARQHIHVVLGPTINLHRSPLGGRLFEAFSEDPLLTGHLAAAYVNGLQSHGVGACLKHLVANESETDRHTVNSTVDERTLREMYLLPFEIAVADSHPWSVMAAYNDINGVAATEQDAINNGILKSEWGWDGLVMSDWFATKTTAASANGGLDLVMPGPSGPWGEALVAAVRAGEVDEATVDDHVRRLLRLASRVGALGESRSWPSVPAPDSDVRREQLTRLAATGMTVLTNDGTLPLAPAARVALIGRHALETQCMGGGSAQVRAPHQVSIAEGLAERLGEGLQVVDGVAVRTRPRPAASSQISDPVTGAAGLRVRVYSKRGDLLKDRHSAEGLVLVGQDDELAEPAHRVVLTATVPAGGRTLGVLGVGEWKVRIGEVVQTVSLEPQTTDLAETVLRPPGWTTDVVLRSPTDLTAEVVMPGWGAVALVTEPTPPTDEEVLVHAVTAACSAEVAVVVVGLTEEQETEAVDKRTLALPGRQDELVHAVAAVAPRTVVVVNAATPVLMPWLSEVHAVVWAGLPGQESGHAVGAALLNEIEPAGRLVTTFPAADGASPAWEVVPTDGVLAYDEGPYVGYRGHAAGISPEPLFWFGHGLGYGSWSYGPAKVSGRTVTVEVTNTSDQGSREVVQVYFDPQSAGQPVRLAGWASVFVPAGSTESVLVDCDPRMWRTWDTGSASWRSLTGGELLVARGLGDVRTRVPLPS